MFEDIKKKINFRHPKYVIPAIIYLPLLFTLYMVCDMFSFTPEETKNNGLEETEYLNSKLPDANIKGDGINGKYESMLDSYGKIRDKNTAVKLAGEDSAKIQAYDNPYKDAEVSAVDENSVTHEQAMAKLEELRDQIRAANAEQAAAAQASESRPDGNTPEEDKQMEDLQRALQEARESMQNGAETAGAGVTNAAGKASATVASKAKQTVPQHNPDAVTAPVEDAPVLEVAKVTKKESEYFNTISVNEPEAKLIKAIIDENIKAVEGSRVRLRLLDELQVGNNIIPAGTYLYAIMSGFGSQRVKGSVKSILINDEILKISLSVYDTDGLEGLYVPESHFREVGKDVASGALQGGGNNFFDSSAPSTFVQMGYQAIQNGYNKVTNAISKAIRKNSVKLKYGTFVYLINSQEQKQNRQSTVPQTIPSQYPSQNQGLYQYQIKNQINR